MPLLPWKQPSANEGSCRQSVFTPQWHFFQLILVIREDFVFMTGT